MDDGASAAASRSVWYPSEDANAIIESGFFALVILERPVRAKSEEVFCGLC
jgi:hypothetical protein